MQEMDWVATTRHEASKLLQSAGELTAEVKKAGLDKGLCNEPLPELPCPQTVCEFFESASASSAFSHVYLCVCVCLCVNVCACV